MFSNRQLRVYCFFMGCGDKSNFLCIFGIRFVKPWEFAKNYG